MDEVVRAADDGEGHASISVTVGRRGGEGGWSVGLVDRRRIWLLCAVLAIVLLVGRADASVRSQALYARGLIPYHSEQWEQAYRWFDKAVQADHTDAGALHYRGLTQAHRGALGAAIQDIEAALKLNPTLPHAALDLGIAYFDAGQYPAAKTWLERAHQQISDRFAAAYFLGLTLYRLGDDAAAVSSLNEAKADPELRPSAQYYAGLAQLRQGNAAAARAELAETAHARPDTEVGKAAQNYGAAVPPEAMEGKPGKPWSVYGELDFQYDTNVVIAPSDSQVKAADGISHQDDGRAVIAAGGEYTLLDTNVGSVRAEYDFYQSVHFNLTEFDLQGHRGRLDFASAAGPVNYGFSGAYDVYLLNYQSFYHAPFATPWIALAEGSRAATQIYYTFRYRDFLRPPYNHARDDFNHAVGVRQFFSLDRPERLLNLGYQFDLDDGVKNDAGARDFEYRGHQVDVGLSSPLFAGTHAQAAYLFRLEDYRFPNSRSGCANVTCSAFNFRRHDGEHEFVVSLTHALTQEITLALDYIGVINGSNIPDFQYDRNIISAGVRVTF